MFFMLDHQPEVSKIRITSSHLMITCLRQNNTLYLIQKVKFSIAKVE